MLYGVTLSREPIGGGNITLALARKQIYKCHPQKALTKRLDIFSKKTIEYTSFRAQTV